MLTSGEQEETDVIATLTGFSLSNVLTGLDLPTGPGLTNQLGISGLPKFSASQIYSENWDDPDAVGAAEGRDWEDEVDQEIREESDGETEVKMEVESPKHVGRRDKRKKVVRRQVERPKTVYERFPTFEKDKVLDFTELFKGRTVYKSRIGKRPFYRTWRSARSPLLS